MTIMIRAVHVLFGALMWGLVVLISSPLLFWLGRGNAESSSSELVVDQEVLSIDYDDPGVDIDG